MTKSRALVCIALVTLAVDIGVARAASAIVGVNVEDVGRMNDEQQDALLDQLKQGGVNTIRTGILHQGLLEPPLAHFIFGASKRGIEAVLLLFPHMGGTGQHTAPTNPAMGRKWPIPALSDADPEGFRKWITPQFAALAGSSVRATSTMRAIPRRKPLPRDTSSI
jgi:hypothetical protein